MANNYYKANADMFTPQKLDFSDSYDFTKYTQNKATKGLNFSSNELDFLRGEQPGDTLKGANSIGNISEDIGGGFLDTQYGDTDIGGAMQAIGIAGQIGSKVIEDSKTENQAAFQDESGTWSQNLVGSVGGTWGAAIYGVSQLGESALESGYDVNDYGYVKNEDYYKFSESLKSGLLDPARNLEALGDDRFSNKEKIQSRLLPGMQGIFEAEHEQEDALKREQEYKDLIARKKLEDLNKNIRDYQPMMQTGGNLPPDSLSSRKKVVQDFGGLDREALQVSSGVVSKLGRGTLPYQNREGFTVDNRTYEYPNKKYAGYSEFPGMNTPEQDIELFDQPVRGGVPVTHFTTVTDSTGNVIEIPVLNEEVSNFYQKRLEEKEMGGMIKKNPSIFNYKTGQSHQGPDNGIPVDSNGVPSSMSKNQAVALTEKGEVTWEGYVFSDELKVK